MCSTAEWKQWAGVILAADIARPDTWPSDLNIPNPGPVDATSTAEHAKLRCAWVKSRVLLMARAEQ